MSELIPEPNSTGGKSQKKIKALNIHELVGTMQYFLVYQHYWRVIFFGNHHGVFS
jgi:hypothetical protein